MLVCPFVHSYTLPCVESMYAEITNKHWRPLSIHQPVGYLFIFYDNLIFYGYLTDSALIRWQFLLVKFKVHIRIRPFMRFNNFQPLSILVGLVVILCFRSNRARRNNLQFEIELNIFRVKTVFTREFLAPFNEPSSDFDQFNWQNVINIHVNRSSLTTI